MRYLITLLLALALSGTASATQPECTGDRHYDETGQCCPLPPTVEPCAACPEIPPCPEVQCVSGSVTNYITVNRCPDVVFPAYAPCRERKPGVCRDGDTIHDGKCYKCPRKGTPRRYFIPQGSAGGSTVN